MRNTFLYLMLVSLTLGCSESIDSTGGDSDDSVTEANYEEDADGIRSLVLDASDTEAWVALHFDRGVVSSDDEWDIAFRRFVIRVNGGSSGLGTAAGQWDESIQLESAESAPETGWSTDGDSADELVLSSWYSYDRETHVLTPTSGVWMLRGGDGHRYYAFAIDSYYDNGNPALYQLRWRSIQAPMSLPELVQGIGSLPTELDDPRGSDDGDADSDTDDTAPLSADGCYSGPPEHMCDCRLSQTECDESEGIWTAQCECGAGDSMDEEPAPSSPADGCYSGPPDHMCDCTLTQEQCAETEGIWTEQCACDTRD